MLTGKSCPKCLMAKQVLFNTYKLNEVREVSLESDEGKSLADKFSIRSIPAFILGESVTFDLKEFVEKLI